MCGRVRFVYILLELAVYSSRRAPMRPGSVAVGPQYWSKGTLTSPDPALLGGEIHR